MSCYSHEQQELHHRPKFYVYASVALAIDTDNSAPALKVKAARANSTNRFQMASILFSYGYHQILRALSFW